MPYWILDLDDKRKLLMLGPYWTGTKAETFKDKNCSRQAVVTSRTKYRSRRNARKELIDEIKEFLQERNCRTG